jgi:hypothetical protein
MASTRNKNTEIDYRIEQDRLQEQAEWQTIRSRRYATNTGMPNVGINVGHMPNDVLARNATDIESRLYGIGLSNLVDPAKPVRPQPIQKSYHEVQFFELPHRETIIPDDLTIAREQRPIIFRR